MKMESLSVDAFYEVVSITFSSLSASEMVVNHIVENAARYESKVCPW